MSRISDGLRNLLDKHADELAVVEAVYRDALALCAHYEARIAELEAAAQWEPVTQYKVGHKYGGLSIEDDVVRVWDDEVEIVKNLPDDIRLCQRRKPTEDSNV